MTVGRVHHGNVRSGAVEADNAVDPLALHGGSALELHAELIEERDRGVEVVDNDSNVVEPLECHQSTYCSGVTTNSSGRCTPVEWFGQ